MPFLPIFHRLNSIGEINCFLRRMVLRNDNSLLTGAESRVTLIVKSNFQNYLEYDNTNTAYFHFVELITNIINEIAPVREIWIRKDSQE